MKAVKPSQSIQPPVLHEQVPTLAVPTLTEVVSPELAAVVRTNSATLAALRCQAAVDAVWPALEKRVIALIQTKLAEHIQVLASGIADALQPAIRESVEQAVAQAISTSATGTPEIRGDARSGPG